MYLQDWEGIARNEKKRNRSGSDPKQKSRNLEDGLGEPARQEALSKPLIFEIVIDKVFLFFCLPSGWFSVFMRARLFA